MWLGNRRYQGAINLSSSTLTIVINSMINHYCIIIPNLLLAGIMMVNSCFYSNVQKKTIING